MRTVRRECLACGTAFEVPTTLRNVTCSRECAQNRKLTQWREWRDRDRAKTAGESREWTDR